MVGIYELSMVRVSIGSAFLIGLTRGLLATKPTTAYLLTHHDKKCDANCGFCPQARESNGRADMLSRVTWPSFNSSAVISRLVEASKKRIIKRICIQALNYPYSLNDVEKLVKLIWKQIEIPISVCSQPIDTEKMKKLKLAGVERIGIPLDGASKEIFNRTKGSLAHGPYIWERHIEILKKALDVFGQGKVTTHLIAGLGENAEEMTKILQWCIDNNVYPSLFSFTPIQGTALENRQQPSVGYYRKMQTARHLIVKKITRYENMKFSEKGELVNFGICNIQLKKVILSGIPFMTSGCPNCNRPYYNENPLGPIYNYPYPPSKDEIIQIEREMNGKKD